MPLSSVLGAQSLVRPGVCTSSTRPASPFEGQVIYETDTDLVQVYNGSGWKILGNLTASQTGSVLQVQSAVKTDTYATTVGATWADIPGLSVSITPKSTSSKILVISDINGAGTATASVVRSRLLRDSTAIYIGDAASNRPRSMAGFYLNDSYYTAKLGGVYLDSPSTTSSTTYKLQIGGDSSGSTVYVNRTQTDRDAAGYDVRTASSITVMEIAG